MSNQPETIIFENKIDKGQIDSNAALSFSDKKECGVVGILNMGNTCYANSVIQILRSIPAFTSFIINNSISVSESAKQELKDFWKAFEELVIQLWKNHRGVIIRPDNYFKSIANLVKGSVYEEFATPIPNDAHEYYIFLLDKLQQATYIPQKPLQQFASEADRAWYKSFEKDYSKIVPLFYGQLKRTLQCQYCKNKSDTYEIFNTIKINLNKNNEPLINSIEATFAPEEIDEYHCNKCNGSHKAIIMQKIIKTPPYLSITINRFTEGFGFGNKDNKTFNLDKDEFLDLSFVVADHTNKHYSLMSMIDHCGSVHRGHYICHIKHIASETTNDLNYNGPKLNQWYLYDDETVHESNKAHISQSTYMLFFRRI
jgi:ubiquitin C-terminal hydrolase